jgi:MoxR-like ATPase
MTQWREFTGNAEGDSIQADRPFPPPPPWRNFADPDRDSNRGKALRPSAQAIKMINIALYLRRPLLITGKPGTGKSSLAYAVTRELGLDPVLHWPINTRSSLQDGLYRYDAIARLRDAQINNQQLGDIQSQMQDIARYIRLGPLGTALLPRTQPRVLLIDEIDKSDIDLPNDLLNVFEEGTFLIPELTRQRVQLMPTTEEPSEPIITHVMADDDTEARISDGRVRCLEFPLVMMTSNNERDFPPAFLRRCLRLDLVPPLPTELASIVQSHFADMLDPVQMQQLDSIIADFDQRRQQPKHDLATDQLLNLIFLLTQDIELTDEIKESVLQSLSSGF